KSGYSKAFAGSTGLNRIDDYAWTDNNANKKTHPPIGTTHPVGTKLPNELGLYDMSGNVWQWCWDWAKDRPSGLLTDFRGSSSGSSRRVRGSNFFYAASAASLTYSDECEPWIVEDLCIGFRVVRN
ncbi:MAG: SUMF1/EgtB/PvdO family nonheme iron enzyme, partial [Brevinematales bacterium]